MKFNINDIITTDGYLKIVESNPDNLCHIKTDYFIKGEFNWRGSHHPKNIKENVIISHSDYSVTDEIVRKFKTVFCVNKSTENSKAFSLPLGIPNNCDDLSLLKIIGDKESLIRVINSESEKENLLYLNFSINTYKNLRQGLVNHFSQFEWSSVSSSEFSMEGRMRYLTQLKKSKFVLCPRGNGIDTHRLWETLYVGSIPIIENFKTHDICHDLPVLFVDDWKVITKSFLEEKYLKISNKQYNLDKLKLSYWENLIKEKITNNV